MSKQKQVKVVQDDANPIAVEVMAASIKAISEGIRKLRAGPLNERALLLLIQHSAPTIRGQRIPISDIKDVLQGIEDLERTYLKKGTT